VARDPTCAGLRGGGLLLYRNPHWGFAVTYPPIFALDPGSVTTAARACGSGPRTGARRP
jgi:hypothetical protein